MKQEKYIKYKLKYKLKYKNAKNNIKDRKIKHLYIIRHGN